MFKYIVQFQLTGNRKCSATIKSEADFDIHNSSHMDFFSYVHDVIHVVEKMWGAGCVKKWEVTEKLQVQRR